MTSPLQPKNPLLPSEIDLHVPVALLSFTIPANLREDYQKSVALIDEFVENYTGKVERNDLLLKICDHVAQLGKLFSTQQFLSILGNVGEYLRILLLSSDYHHVYCSVIIQDGLIKNGDYRVHTVIGRYMNMKTLSKVSRRRQLGKTKEETALGYFIADVIQAWGEAFEPRAALYPYIPETYHRLKFKHSCLFLRPDYDPTRVPIFLPEMTRQQMEEVEYLNRSASRPSTAFENKGTYSSPPVSSSPASDRERWSSSPGGSDESRSKPAKPPLPRQRSSMSPPGKPPKPPTPVRSASLSSRPAEQIDLLNSPWSDSSVTDPKAPMTTPESQPSVYDERSVQHVLAVFSTPTNTCHPTSPSSELRPWTPMNQDSSLAGVALSSNPRSADVAFDLTGEFKPQSVHSLLERYVSETAVSSPLARRSSGVSSPNAANVDNSSLVPSNEHYDQQPPVASNTYGVHDESSAVESSDSTKDVAPDTQEIGLMTIPEQDKGVIVSDHSLPVHAVEDETNTSHHDEIASSVDVSTQGDLLPSEDSAAEPSHDDVPIGEKQDAVDVACQSEQETVKTEPAPSDATSSSAPPRRLSKSSPVPEGPSELEKAFALRHLGEPADEASSPGAASSEGGNYNVSQGAVPPAKPKRQLPKTEIYDPASDKNVEVKFFGNQRVLVRKSSAGAIPKYF